MLVKVHSSKYVEDFGLKTGNTIHLYYKCLYGDDFGENRGPVEASKSLKYSPVLHVNAAWLDRNLKVKCHVADTEEKKRAGLQPFSKLEDNEGMYFPYLPEGETVTFHQGSVKFGLDLIFLRDDKIARIEADTKPGSSERWSCNDCTGVIEVNAGFCFENDVNVGDRIALFAVSQKDLDIISQEQFEDLSSGNYSESNYTSNHALHLVSQIVDNL